MLTLPEKFTAENAKDHNEPALIVEMQKGVIASDQTTQADWAANTGESNVDYTPTPPDAGDVILEKETGCPWTELALSGGTPSIRRNHSGIAYNGNLYVFGGLDAGTPATYYNDLWKYDVGSDAWSQLSPSGSLPSARFGHSAVTYGGKIYIFGGQLSGGSKVNDLWVYDIAGNSWAELSPSGSLPTARGFHGSSLYNGKMYVFGGDDGTAYARNDLWVYDIAGNSWAQLSPSGTPPGRFGTLMVPYGGKLYLFGGVVGGDKENDLWVYDISGNSWTELSPSGTPPAERYVHAGDVYNDKMYVFGGYKATGYSNDLWEYNITSNSWSEKTTSGGPPTARAYHSATMLGGKLFVFGGSYASVSELNDLWENLLGYKLAGYIYTRHMDLGETPSSTGEWFIEDTRPENTSITYEAWASDTGAFSGEETSLGEIEDGDLITVLKRYYRVKATLETTDGGYSPAVQRIKSQFESFESYSDTRALGFEPSVMGASSLTTNIDTFEKSTISQVDLTFGLTPKVSNWLATQYPRNKTLKVKAGFVAPGWTRDDYIDYFVGAVEDWSLPGNYEAKLSIRDYSKSWKQKVPAKWESAADDVTWTNEHPIDVMLDILRNRINVRDSKIVVSSFDAVKTALSGWQVSRTITEDPEEADELLQELRILMGCYFIPQADGRIKIKRWDPDEAAVDSFDERNFKNVSWAANSGSLVNQTHIYFGWNGEGTDAADFSDIRVGLDATSQTNWGEQKVKEIKDKWTLSADSSQIEALEAAILARYANPPAIITGDAHRSKIHLEVGDIVTVSTPHAPSSDMSGISGVKFQIVNRNLDHKKDTIRLKLLEV